MLLRRITNHVKNENWFAVFIDFLIVVVGVFIGIQVANWNDQRQMKNQQNLVETRLLSDFQFINQELTQAEAYSKKVILSLDTLRSVIQKGEATSQEDKDVKFALLRGYSHPTFVRHSPTYSELVSSGRLDLIKQDNLRIGLARYDEQSENRMFNLAQVRNLIDSYDVYLAKYAEYAPLDRNNISISEVAKYNIHAMASDTSYRDKLNRLINAMTWIHSNLTNQRADVDAVINLMANIQ